MEPVIKVKLELVLKLKDIKATLKDRGIAVNQANIKRLVGLVRDAPIAANSEFYESVPTDKEILLMYGFTFTTKEGTPSGKINTG